MPKLIFKGTDYIGWDPATSRHVVAMFNDVVDVSEVKAEQLTQDFPEDWSYAADDIEVTGTSHPAARYMDDADAARDNKAGAEADANAVSSEHDVPVDEDADVAPPNKRKK